MPLGDSAQDPGSASLCFPPLVQSLVEGIVSSCISNLYPHPLTPLNHISGSDQWQSPPLGGQIWEESIHALEAAWYLVRELWGPGA